MRVRGSVLGALGVALVFAAPAMGQGKNVQLVKTIPEGKWATAINFLEYRDGGHGHGSKTRDVMMVTGAAIIVASGLYTFYRERIRHRTLAAESSGLPPDGL